MIRFEQFFERLNINSINRVVRIDVTLEIKNCTGEVNITDLLLQGGPRSTMWTGHPSEFRWSNDN